MKKKNLFLRIAAALTAALLLSSCSSPLPTKEAVTEEETEDPNVGRYYLGSLTMGGEDVELTENDVEQFFLRLKDDGKATLQVDEEKYDGSWKVRKEVLTLKLDSSDFDKDAYEGSIEDGIINIEIDGARLVLVKGKSAAKAYLKAHPATKAETAEATTEPTTEAPTEPATEAPTEPATEAPTEPSTEAPTEPSTEAPTEPSTEAPTEPDTKPVQEGAALSVTEQLVLDRGGIRVTAMKVVEDDWYGVGIEFKVENNTDKDIYVGSEYVSVNGAMIEEDFYCRAEPGKTETDTLYLDEELLEWYSIKTIGYVDVLFRAVDRGDYSTIFEEDKPIRIRTNNYGKEDKPQVPEDSVRLFDDKGVQIHFVHTAFDNYGDLYSLMYVVNDTGKRIIVDYGKMFLNDTEVDAFIFDTIDTDCVMLCQLEYDEDSVKELGLDSLDDLKSAGFTFIIEDFDSYDDIVDTGLLKLEYAD